MTRSMSHVSKRAIHLSVDSRIDKFADTSAYASAMRFTREAG